MIIIEAGADAANLKQFILATKEDWFIMPRFRMYLWLCFISVKHSKNLENCYWLTFHFDDNNLFRSHYG
jgi:hypothetical protein